MDWPDKPSAWRTRGALARAGGWLAIVVSVALLVIVLARDVGLNPLNGWTIGLGLLGGAVAIRAATVTDRVAATVIVLLAAVPALLGGMGLLYVPSLALIPLGGRRARRTSDGLKASDREERFKVWPAGTRRPPTGHITQDDGPLVGRGDS